MSLDTTLRCSDCGGAMVVSFAECLERGWPKCCHGTMTLVETTAEIEKAVDDLVDLDSCLFCGCTTERACEGGCWWVAPGICSGCADLAVVG